MHCSGQSRTWESGSAEIPGIVGCEWMESSYSLQKEKSSFPGYVNCPGHVSKYFFCYATLQEKADNFSKIYNLINHKFKLSSVVLAAHHHLECVR